jgi:hypothetical protein
VVVEDEGRELRVKIAERPKRRTAKVEADDVADAAVGATGRRSLRRSAEEKALARKERLT